MIKFIGILLMLVSAVSLEQGFELSLVLWFLFGLFLVLSRGICSHLLFVEREKVRAKYRRRR